MNSFPLNGGAPPKNALMAIGGYDIKEVLRLSDEDTVAMKPWTYRQKAHKPFLKPVEKKKLNCREIKTENHR